MNKKLKGCEFHLSGKAAFAIAMAITLNQVQPAHAGWSGVMNGVGFGWAAVNVTSASGVAKSITSPNVTGPGAAMTTATGYTVSTTLPDGASTNTVARIKGSAGYIWQAKSAGSNGDKTDNLELESRVQISPYDCPSLEVETTLVPSSFDGHSGSISVKALATPGTAMWFRGFEYTGDPSLLPQDDPSTPQNETIEFLKLHGQLKFESLLVGPFDYASPDRCALVIPFTVESGNQDNLFLASDGVVKSNPLQLIAPADITIECGATLVYPDIQFTGGCGAVNVTYSPAASSLHLGENIITVSALDGKNDTSSTTFKVTVVDTALPTISAPANLSIATDANSCVATGVTLGTPVAGDTCGVVTVVNNAPAAFPIGDTLVTWTATDTSGNKATAVQTVSVADHTAPVPDLASLPVITGECSAAILSAPTATDNCAGQLVGTTTDSLSYNLQGTFTVTWSFNDGHGNISTQTQTVKVKDVTPPAVPVLPTISGQCTSQVTLVAPTTTDNCSGIVTGTTADPLVYRNAGTYTVHWTFTDAAGNSSYANQTVTVAGYKFEGFESPINGTGGSYAVPLRSFITGCSLPIAFDFVCGSSYLCTGTPTYAIYKASSATSLTLLRSGNFTLSGSKDWLYNWNTKGVAKGVYKIVATLQNGTTAEVFISLK